MTGRDKKMPELLQSGFAPSPSVSASGGYPSRDEIAGLLYAATNRILRTKLWDGWEPAPLADDPAACEAHYAYADVVLAALPAAQSMETAPKDGTKVLGYWPDFGNWAVMAWDRTESRHVTHWLRHMRWTPAFEPSAWMPLPPAPGGEAASAAETGTGSAEGKHPIGEAEASVNSHLLSALKAMDAALIYEWTDPEDAYTQRNMPGSMRLAWIQIRSAITRAEAR